jgi:squalene synthase HpnC
MGVGHYENFPVASVLVPGRLRPAVRAIYRVARTADDIADEGDATPAWRLAQLDALARDLDAIERGQPTAAWADLAGAIAQHGLRIDYLRALLSAFSQDVSVKRYADRAALLDYCARSANPIGRLMLQLFERHEAVPCEQADAICSGLQLVNFWQDVAIDWHKGRVYVPQDELERHGVTEAQVAEARVDAAWTRLMGAQTAHARAMLEAGRPLGAALGGRIGLELRLVVAGGLRIAERIDAVAGDVFRQRPALGVTDWIVMFGRAFAVADSTAPPAQSHR